VTLDGLADVEVEFTANGGTRTLSKVQLEAGSTATPFRRNGNSIEDELAACQRYYYRTGSETGNLYATLAHGASYSSTASYTWMRLPVTMRIPPVSIEWSSLALTDNLGYSLAVSNLAINDKSRDLIQLVVTHAGNATVNRFANLQTNNTASGFVGLSAEL
jgi:hypothetical protein